ncbi:MAG: penicillin acylase family protein [Actinomycetota bacterium]|nr:penicillin acylase family protein [Actinomycetota bacterium]
MARIYRDAYGVPHVRATTVLDLAHGQGEVVARDRAWQMEWLRRRATGTTAEIFGSDGLPWDRLARRALLVDTARRAHERLDDESQAFVAAYVDGVNAGLHADAPELTTLGIKPQPWPEWMPLATFHAQHILFGSLGSKLWERRARAVLGDDAVLLSHEGPLVSGSNAWAVGGGRTASGLPLIGGDPHRVIESPGVYLQIRLACDEFDVAGFTFAGVPGVQHFAHAGEVAWAITNAMADYQDVHDAGPVVERWTETIVVRDQEPVQVEVAITERGPVFTDGLSFQGVSTVLGDLGFGALLPLLRARTVDDVDHALDAWVEPVNNAVIADRHGAVRYRIAGRIPLRDGEAWTGWHGANRAEIPARGQVVTANERRGPESDLVGVAFAPAYRAERINALLDGLDGLTPADFRDIHNDTYLATVPLLRSLVPGEFDDWDGRMDADSAGAARFAAWRNALVRRIAAEPVFAPLHAPVADLVHAPWLDVTGRIGLSLPSLVAAAAPYGIDLRKLARLALDESRDHPATWGATHVATPVHAFQVTDLAPPEVPLLPVDGDGDCVRCTGSLPGVTDEAYRGSVARYVWDLADREASGWVVPLGAAGHPDHPHHRDQLPIWVAGDLVPLVTRWDLLSEEPA